MNLKIRITAAAMTAAILLASGCHKKPEVTIPSETPATTDSETVTESTTESTEETSKETEQTTYATYTEYGNGAFPCTVKNVILKNTVNVNAAIHTYDGVKGLDSGWLGTHWIDVTAWMMEMHNYKISDDYLKCGSPEYRYHVVTAKNDVKITFTPAKELEKKSYDGFDVPDEVPVALANIEISLPDGFKIVIADSGEEAGFDISGSGRGWYLTKTQIAVAEYVLECLEKDASKDPLADIFDHKTISKKNTYTF